ncbi:regulator of microtubule dynamics protein 1-like, partial [Aphis craccivora]
MFRNRVKHISWFVYESFARTIGYRQARRAVKSSPNVRFPVALSLSFPLFGYNKTNLTNSNELELAVDNDELVLEQKLIEADQLFLVNKYEDVVRLLGEYK